jgi:hypothetical protein
LTQHFPDFSNGENRKKAGNARTNRQLGPFVFVELRYFIDRHLRFQSQELDGSLLMGLPTELSVHSEIPWFAFAIRVPHLSPGMPYASALSVEFLPPCVRQRTEGFGGRKDNRRNDPSSPQCGVPRRRPPGKTISARAPFETARKDMNKRTQVDQSPNLPIWIATVATTLLCAAGIAAFMAWLPTATGNPNDDDTLTERLPMSGQPASAKGEMASAGAASDTLTRATCAGCGVIESVREIDTRDEQAAESTRGYEVTIRLQDGSMRVFNEATPRTWRSGTRIMVIN